MNPYLDGLRNDFDSPTARLELEYSRDSGVRSVADSKEIRSSLGGGDSEWAPTAVRHPGPVLDFEEPLREEHQDCRICHPELGPDWVRFWTQLGIAGGTLAFWVFVTAWCTERYL